MSDSGIHIAQRRTTGGMLVGHAELDVPGTLNSLTLPMIRALTPAIRAWRGRDDIAAVVITAAGDKAFCAGGDIQALYHAIVANQAAGDVVDDYPFRFFEEEYRLDYAIHTFPKPVITVGHGIVMGGGLGILGASTFRVLTERSRLAVPEITIGLFPDAGGTWTLGKMPRHFASFLGLTGSQVNAADGLLTGMGTHVVPHAMRRGMLDAVLGLPFTGTPVHDRALVADWLDRLTPPELPVSELAAVPEREVATGDLAGEVAGLNDLAGRSDWVDRGLINLNGGCPTTAGIVLEQLARVDELTLADSFRMELTVATHCARNHDFREGVRALLIDKDNQPDWQYGSIQNLDYNHVLSHFEPPWSPHPLADLGDEMTGEMTGEITGEREKS